MRTVNNTSVNPARKYVIVSNVHSGASSANILFWGRLTADNEKRSFGGYTADIDSCERYTMDEIVAFSTKFAVYHLGMTYEDFRKRRNIIIEPKDLGKLGLSTMRIWYKP